MPSSPALVRHLLSPDFRTLHALARRPPRTFRVLAVGDSYTFGFGVADHESLPAQLQRTLNRSLGTPFVEVLNAGRPGMNLIEEWAFLRQLGSWLEYDFLLLCLSSDDASPWSRWELMRRDEPGWREEWKLQWHPESRSVPHLLTALGTVVQEERRAGRGMAVAFYEPVSGTSELPRAVLPRVCETLGVPFLDLCAPFQRFPREVLAVSAADVHPSPMAHRIAAAETAAFLRPLLPDAAADRETAEQALRQRLEALVRVDEGPAPAGLAYRHLASLRQALAPGEPLTAEIEALRQALNAEYRTLLLDRVLQWVRRRLGQLGDKLFRLERLALMTRLGVAGTEAGLPAEDLWPALATGAAHTRRALAGLDAPAPCGSREPAGGDGLRELIHGLREESEARRHNLLRGSLRRIAAEVDTFCAAVERVAQAQSGVATLPGAEGPELGHALRQSLESFGGWIEAASRAEGDDSRAELVVQVRLPAGADIQHADLVCELTAVAPFARTERQVQYVLADGGTHAYRFALPEGAVGHATLELKVSYGRPDEPVPETDGEALRQIVLVQGAAQRPYTPGDLLYSPLARQG